MLNVRDVPLTASDFKPEIDELTQTDDVFNQCFISTIMVQKKSSSSDPKQFPPLIDLIEGFDCLDSIPPLNQPVNRFCYFECVDEIPSGPYFYDEKDHALYPALKLYPDTHEAFACGLLRSKKDVLTYVTDYVLSPVLLQLIHPSPLTFNNTTATKKA